MKIKNTIISKMLITILIISIVSSTYAISIVNGTETVYPDLFPVSEEEYILCADTAEDLGVELLEASLADEEVKIYGDIDDYVLETKHFIFDDSLAKSLTTNIHPEKFNYPILNSIISPKSIYIMDRNNILDNKMDKSANCEGKYTDISYNIINNNNKYVNIIAPTKGYLSGTCYEMHISNDILTYGGNSLDSDFLYEFYIVEEE